MKHSWTGGQYSLWRALLAITLAIAFDHVLPANWMFPAAAGVLCAALMLGFHDRLAAFLLAVAWWAALPNGGPARWSISLLLLLHATTHGSPYGTIDARGRTDPAGGWILPRWNFAARRLLLLAAIVASFARGRFEFPWGPAAALLLSSVDPGWIPARRSEVVMRVYYDGTCGLCHRFVRFLLAEDRRGTNFRFAPLQGEGFRGAYPADVRRTYPDSIVVADEKGRVLIRSRAVLHALSRLGGLWRLVAAFALVVPVPIRDLVYDGVALARHRFFPRPSDVCPMVPAHLARRFDT